MRPLIQLAITVTNAIFFLIRSSQQIREQIGRMADQANEIVQTAEREGRELTAEEKQRIDQILAEADGLRPELERAERVEALAAGRVTGRQAGGAGGDGAGAGAGARDLSQQAGGNDNNDDRPLAQRITIPAEQRYRHATLRAYSGQYAEERAFMAGMWFLATLGENSRAREWCQSHGVDTRFRGALTGTENTLGGFVVPGEMEQTVIDLREQYGVFRRFSRILPMGSDTKDQPIRSSGLTAYFSDDRSGMTESEKAWSNAKLVAKKLYALTRYSLDLDEDSIISLGDDLTREIAHSFAVKEDDCGFNGNGSSTYGGIVGLKSALKAGSKATAAAGNVTFGTLDWDDFTACMGKLPEYPGIMPAWFISKPGWAASMLRLATAAGGNTAAMLARGESGMLEFLGYPVVWTHVLPTALTGTASTILAYFGDLAMATLMGNRRGMSVQMSDQRYFEYDHIGIKGTERFDITCHSVGTASAAGAMIALVTPGS